MPVGRVEAKLRYRLARGAPRRVETTARGFPLHLDEPAYGVARGQAAVLYEATSSSGQVWSRPLRLSSLRRRDASHSRYGDLAHLALAVFLSRWASALGWAFLRLAVTFDRLSSFIKGTEREVLPVINKVGGSVDRVNAQLDKVDTRDDSAVDAVAAVDEAVRTVSFAVKRPVQKLAGLHGRRLARLVVAQDAREAGASAVDEAKAAAARRERDLEEELKPARWLTRSRLRCRGSPITRASRTSCSAGSQLG